MNSFFETKIEFLKGVGPKKSAILNKELSIFTFADLIQHYPFRYEDRSNFNSISEIVPGYKGAVQIKGKVAKAEKLGASRKKRLVAQFVDEDGQFIELIWFKGIDWVAKNIKPGIDYVIYGKPTFYQGTINIAHPEIEPLATMNRVQGLFPVYHTSESMKRHYLDSKGIAKIQKNLLLQAKDKFRESLSNDLLRKFRLIDKRLAMIGIHFPKDLNQLNASKNRLKFEELFYNQLKILKSKTSRIRKFKGQVLNNPKLLTTFYEDHLPFDLTNAQKRVIKEIYQDVRSGIQMNRLLQGDVGSGKTIVSFICVLLAIGNDAQAALMAPTEILSEQHFRNLSVFANQLGFRIELLTGSTKKAKRRDIHEGLLNGDVKLLVGTHALLEDKVQFRNLAMAIVDEQHRFGVAQRARLWKKNLQFLPHILVMTATPIPRTLAMTLYGDLDVSVIDELPAGRKPIITEHRFDSHRLKVFSFMKKQMSQGRQIYMVYPLIEESAKMDYKDLMDGYESISRAFPDVPISIVHGRMKSKDKDYEMMRFSKGETKIMVATTVIEVGVDVPNASVMVIESAQRFGLSQLHQLRGRVGRGGEQSYCILMSDFKLSKEAKIRLETMVRTNNGFEIADVDLKLRGPGDMSGTQQSGVTDLIIADLSQDSKILTAARHAAEEILENDPDLVQPENSPIRLHVDKVKRNGTNWAMIS